MEHCPAFLLPLAVRGQRDHSLHPKNLLHRSSQPSQAVPQTKRRCRHFTITASTTNPSQPSPSPPTTPLVIPDPTAAASEISSSKNDIIWEIDFYSRPVLDSRRKKIWELIIVDSQNTFQHIEQVPNSAVNSKELRKRVQKVMDECDVEDRPRMIRYFRAEMGNMIRIGLEGIGLVVKPSRRSYALIRLVKQREREVYPEMVGYDESIARMSRTTAGVGVGSALSVGMGGMPDRMPDAMRGEQFVFTQLGLEEIEGFFEESDVSDYFGEKCLVDEDMDRGVSIPGLCILSERAKGVAAWTSGSEIVYIKAKLQTKNITFECGTRTSYLLAKVDKELKDDAKKFEELKTKAGGLHFLSIQDRKNPELVEGFWLLRDIEML